LGRNNIKNIKQTYKDEIFSIAMTILYAATLGRTFHVYNWYVFIMDFEQFKKVF
jgi:hypothetical protein